MRSIHIMNGHATIKTNSKLNSIRHANSTKVDLSTIPGLNSYLARNPGTVLTVKTVKTK